MTGSALARKFRPRRRLSSRGNKGITPRRLVLFSRACAAIKFTMKKFLFILVGAAFTGGLIGWHWSNSPTNIPATELHPLGKSSEKAWQINQQVPANESNGDLLREESKIACQQNDVRSVHDALLQLLQQNPENVY